jgi:four helix bundle protein
MATTRFEQVGVWQKAHASVLAVYQLTAQFPKHETYSLSSQLRRAAVSVPANFAEGYKKASRADKARFLNIAQGSLEESRYYLILARDLGYADTTEMTRNLEEISRMLTAYHRQLLSPVS